jgi:hypothetical protein
MSQNNPLEKFYRKPKLHLSLPSKGRWYPPGAIQLSEDGTIPVYAMTAKDDMLFRSGDTLLEQKSTYDLLTSCVPAIKEPAAVPNVDVDALLLAIRKATYGSELKMTVVVPNTALKREVMLNIDELLVNQGSAEAFDEDLTIENEDGDTMQVKVKPAPLRALFDSTKTVIAQRDIFRTVQNDDISDDEKIAKINDAFRLIDKASTSIIVESIESMTINNEAPITNQTAIRNYLANCDSEYFNAIKNHIDAQKKLVTIRPAVITATEEEIALGAPATFEVEVEFTNVEFFK